jgi:catechol 1,2-dioxygenase
MERTMRADRTRTILEALERTALEFMRKHRVTHAEYRRATDIIIDTVKSGEGSLLFDVLFEAEATDIGNTGRKGSREAVEGPFYFPDMWQADAAGLYSNVHPDIPDWNLRGRFRSDADGCFEVRTIVPPPYEIPKHGPTGIVLKALGRHFFRPAHLHFKVRHPKCAELTSQLYFDGGKYLNDDVANAVREGLTVKLSKRDTSAASTLPGPYFEASYDFILTPLRQPSEIVRG